MTMPSAPIAPRRAGIFAAVCALAAMLMLSGCMTTNPATGESQFTPFMSPDQEKQVGASEHPKILEQFGGPYEDPALSGYIAAIGGRVAANSELPATNFTITVLDTPTVNAFALPGGYVYITRGLLALANSEAEVAGVLAHEVGHVTARHTAQRYNRAIGGNLAATAVGILTGSNAAAQLTQLGAQGYLASFSRDQEYQADSLGIRYMARAGYAPIGQAQLLQSLGNYDALQRRLNDRKDRGNDFFATHPQTPDRVRRAVAIANKSGAPPNAPFRREAFLKQINGMIFGDSPEEGIIRGREFLHPILRFSFQVPDGYRLVNSPTAVYARGPGDAVIVFDQESDKTEAARARDMASYLANRWGRKIDVRGIERIEINGLPAATGYARVNTRSGAMDARLVAIRFEERRIFRFLFMTPPKRTAALAEGLKRTTYSFRKLNQKQADAIKPLRIRVVTVGSGDTRQSMARRMIVDKDPQAWFDTLNALGQNDRLRVGQKVKIISE